MTEKVSDLIKTHKGKIPKFLLAAVISFIGGREVLQSFHKGNTLSDVEAISVTDTVRALEIQSNQLDLGGGGYVRFNEKVVSKNEYLQNIFSLVILLNKFGAEFQIQTFASGETLLFSGDVPTDLEIRKAFEDILHNGELQSIVTKVYIPESVISELGDESTLPELVSVKPDEVNYVFDKAKQLLTNSYNVDATNYSVDIGEQIDSLGIEFTFHNGSTVETVQTSSFAINDADGHLVGYVRITQYNANMSRYYSVSHSAIDNFRDTIGVSQIIIPFASQEILNIPNFTVWRIDQKIMAEDRTPKTTLNVP